MFSLQPQSKLPSSTLRTLLTIVVLAGSLLLLKTGSYSGEKTVTPQQITASSAAAKGHSFKKALPGYTYSFPRDHGAHEAFKTEWWYYTGHLETQEKHSRRYGFEVTFFRIGNNPTQLPDNAEWAAKQIHMADFAISDENTRTFFHTKKLNRAALGRAGASRKQYHVWNENWSVKTIQPQGMKSQHHLKAKSPKYSLDLKLTPRKPIVIHGKNGISKKASCVGCASHYYSFTRLLTEGDLSINGKTVPVKGISWMDHEFGSNQLAANQVGWDWFSIQLDNHTELMLYQLRQTKGRIDENSSGTIIFANGHSKHLNKNEISIIPTDQWKSPKSKGLYPMGWQIEIPSESISLKITPSFKAQELYTPMQDAMTYWEGSSKATGTHKEQPVAGEAYVEMTGYDKPFKQAL